MIAPLGVSHPWKPFVKDCRFSLHERSPPKQGAQRLPGQAPRVAYPPGRLAPGVEVAWGPPAAWLGRRCTLSVSPEAGRWRFSGFASIHTNLRVKSEVGDVYDGVDQNVI